MSATKNKIWLLVFLLFVLLSARSVWAIYQTSSIGKQPALDAGGGGTDYTGSLFAYWYLEEASSPSDNAEGTASWDWTWAGAPAQDVDQVQGTYSLDFDASGSDRGYYAVATGHPGDDYSGDWQIMGWVKVEIQTADKGILTLGTQTNQRPFGLMYQNSTDDFIFQWTVTDAPQSVVSTLDIGTGWYFVIIEHDYVDGTNDGYSLWVGDATTAVTEYSTTGVTHDLNAGGTLFFGAGNNGAYVYLDGKMDAWAIAKTLFTEAQLNEIRQYGYDGNGW